MAADDVRPVFAYGSLLHKPSLLRTLAHRPAAPPAHTARPGGALAMSWVGATAVDLRAVAELFA